MLRVVFWGAEDRRAPLLEKNHTTGNSLSKLRRVAHLSSDLHEFQPCVCQMCVCTESLVYSSSKCRIIFGEDGGRADLNNNDNDNTPPTRRGQTLSWIETGLTLKNRNAEK